MDDKKLKKLLDFFSYCFEESAKRYIKVSVFNNVDMSRSEIKFSYSTGNTKFETETVLYWDKFNEDADSYSVEINKNLENIYEKINVISK